MVAASAMAAPSVFVVVMRTVPAESGCKQLVNNGEGVHLVGRVMGGTGVLSGGVRDMYFPQCSHEWIDK